MIDEQQPRRLCLSSGGAFYHLQEVEDEVAVRCQDEPSSI